MSEPIRVVLVEDNKVFREALELLLGLRSDMEVVASVPDGSDAAEVAARMKPDVVLMDYRLPGLDGVQATRAVKAACPEAAVVCLTASANLRERDALTEAGRGRLPAQGRRARRDRRGDPRRRPAAGRVMQLTAENTAIVVDSTADFPEAPERFPNWRVVPLYVRFGDESFRDYVELSPEQFYARLRTAPETPSTSQPTPGDFLAAYEELAGYERILSLHIAGKLSGTIESARAAARELGDERVRTIDSESASAAIAMLGLAIQRRLERGTTDEEVDALVERYRREAGLLFTVDTLEYLARGGRIGRARAWAGELLNIKPILSIEDGEVLPVKRVRGNRKAFLEFASAFEAATRRPAEPAGRHRPRRGAGSRRGAAEDGARQAARGRDRARHDPRPGRRRSRRPGDGRLLLVRRRRVMPQRFLD